MRRTIGSLGLVSSPGVGACSTLGSPPAWVASAAMAAGLPGPEAPPLALVGWFSESLREDVVRAPPSCAAEPCVLS